MERSITQLARLDALVVSVARCLVQTEKRGALRQKLYSDKFTSHVSEAFNLPIRKFRKFVQIWEPEELEFQSEVTKSDSEEKIKRKGVRQPRPATHVVLAPSVNRIFITSESKRLTNYVEEELGRIYDRYIADVSKKL